MRSLVLAAAALVLAGCASAPVGTSKLVYDHKSNSYSVAAAPAPSDFVGTSAAANAPSKAAPSWSRFGHP